MKKKYRPWDTDRTYLLPPSTRDWLPEGHLAGFILDVVSELDLSAIEKPIQAKDPRGERPYDPRMMVALLLYGYANGVFSSRRLEHATWTDLGARFIAAETHPHFTTINSFRLVHHEALAALFLQILRLCEKAGLVSLGHVAIDGTKIQANASKHKAMSYDRMKATEARLQAEVDALLAEADAVNKAEDEEFGDSDGSGIPEELRRRETRKERIRQARLALEEEAKAARRLALEEQGKRARERAAEADDPKAAKRLERHAERREQLAADIEARPEETIPGAGDELPFHKVKHDKHGVPKPKAQRNFTDPESRIMESGGSYLQAFNCQVAVAESYQVIVAQVLTNQPPDYEHLIPLLEQTRTNLDAYPEVLTADAGYWGEENGQFCEDRGIDTYISTRRRKHREHHDREDEARPPPPPSAKTERGKAMEEKVMSDAGREQYAKRKWVVEPVFGQVKEARGFRRFHLRGLHKTRSEFSLVCTGHNLLKLWRHGPAK